jgi:hypothetical protein
MLRLFLLLAAMLQYTNVLVAATVLEKPVIDERVELLSIAFRLAECDEYSSERNFRYVESINRHFNAFKKHALITYIKKIRKYGIGYDAVMRMAIHIDKAPNFSPLVKFDELRPEQRWGTKRGLKFIQLLRAFYKDANCASFFEQEKEYYHEVIEAFIPIYEKLDLEWYTTFYGTEPEEKFVIIIGPGNGGGNYGPSLVKDSGEKEVYAIMGAWEFDSLGNSIFEAADYFPVLLHEFNHSFVNPLLPPFKNDLSKSCSALFEAVNTEMQNQAYGDWEVMFNESVVRAAVIQYMMEHNFEPKIIEAEINDQFYRGFIWMPELVKKMAEYADNRTAYPTFNDFMPELVKTFATFHQNLADYETKFNASRPKVVSLSEFENGAKNVSPTTKTITINFNTEMQGPAYSINYGELGKKAFPKISNVYYRTDKKSVVLEVTLKSNHTYQFILSNRGFKSKENIPIKDYEITFKTKSFSKE